MKRLSLAIALAVIVAGHAAAGDPAWPWWCVLYPAHRPCPSCPDDYCPKPLPCVRGTPPGCADDYGLKPLPCVRGVSCLGANDYCPKRPVAVPCCYPPWYKCVPPKP
ncbi:MAG: hypothetical protein ACJ8F7_09615 [Gemmataceae bacterium]